MNHPPIPNQGTDSHGPDTGTSVKNTGQPRTNHLLLHGHTTTCCGQEVRDLPEGDSVTRPQKPITCPGPHRPNDPSPRDPNCPKCQTQNRGWPCREHFDQRGRPTP